ncbi:type VI secretion system baseplate subunit TssK [Hydrogenimonas sp.]
MPKRVAWREGLFIRPQHFQQTCYSVTDEFMLRSRMDGPNRWGLFELSIDTPLLSAGKFSLSNISGVLPDGTIFGHGDFVKRPTLDILPEDAGKNIYLALPLNFPDEENTWFEEGEPLPTRYMAVTENDIPNMNAGENSRADITFAYPNFTLLKEDEKRDGYSTIQVARIGEIGVNGAVSLDETFQPTFLHLDAAGTIASRLGELEGILRFRAEKIAEKISTGSLQTAELGDYLLLQLINRTIARLHYYATQKGIHPGDLFLELTSLLGELAVFMQKEKRPSKKHTYIHAEQYRSFDHLFQDLKEYLNQAIESKSVRIPLEKHRYGVHTAMLKDKSILHHSHFILTAAANTDENKLKKLLMDNLKIGSIEEIRNLVNHHLPGFKITPLAAAPREIPYRVNQSYFSIRISKEEREKLMQSAGLAMHYPETKNLQLEFSLWAIKNR